MAITPQNIGKLALYLFDVVRVDFEKQRKSGSSLESLYRNIVGRFYYAILKEAEDHYNVTIVGPDEHSQIIEAVRDDDQQNLLTGMRRLRRKADYKLYQKITYGDVTSQKFDYEDLTGQLI